MLHGLITSHPRDNQVCGGGRVMAQGLLHVCSDHEEPIQEIIIYIHELRFIQCSKKTTDANASCVSDRVERVREREMG